LSSEKETSFFLGRFVSGDVSLSSSSFLSDNNDVLLAEMEYIDKPEGFDDDVDNDAELEEEEFNISSTQGLCCCTFVSSLLPAAAAAAVVVVALGCVMVNESSVVLGKTRRTVHDSLRFSLDATGMIDARANIIAMAIAMASSTSDVVGGLFVVVVVVIEYG